MGGESLTEFDLRHALTGQAATITSTADPSRLRDGMVRADRLRTVRAAATAGVMAVVVAFGVLNLQGVEERSLVDVEVDVHRVVVDHPRQARRLPGPNEVARVDERTRDAPRDRRVHAGLGVAFVVVIVVGTAFWLDPGGGSER